MKKHVLIIGFFLASIGLYLGQVPQSFLTATSTKTAAYNAQCKELVVCDASAGSFTVTLPTSPAEGCLIGVETISVSTNQTVIKCGGSNTFLKSGGATTFSLNSVGSIILQYKSTGVWLSISQDASSTSLSGAYVPYSGATGSVNLGTQNLSTGGVITTSALAVNSNSTTTGVSITADITGNTYPFILNGTSGNNPRIILQGANNSIINFSNTATSTQWIAANNTIAGNNLDDFGWGQTSGTSNWKMFLKNSTGDVFVRNKMWIGASSNNTMATTAPTLQITGTGSVSSTFTVAGVLTAQSTANLGSAGLTGGNTGTVAVLTDVPFPICVYQTASNPADAATYYIGQAPHTQQTTNASPQMLPYNCTLVGWSANFQINTTAASAGNSTLSIYVDGAATSLSSVITMTAASGVNTFTASGLSTNFNAGSMVSAQLLTPTWATNPAGVAIGITFWFVRRQ